MENKKHTVIYTAYDDHEDYDYSIPEKELLYAVLMSALNDLKNPGKEARKAMEFLLDPNDDYLFSFKSICDHLKVDPQDILVHAGLKQKKEKNAVMN